MPGIKFTTEESLPVTERENEFRAVIKDLAANSGKIVSYIVEEKTYDESMAKVAADKRKMAEAGNELTPPVTVKTPRVEKLANGKAVKVWVTVGPKIKRTRKTADSPAAQ